MIPVCGRMQKDGLYQSGVQRHSVCTDEKKVQIPSVYKNVAGCRWNCCSERRTTVTEDMDSVERRGCMVTGSLQ